MPELTCDDYKFGTEPFTHQLEAFLLSRDAEYFALIMEQGTGKSKVTTDTCGWLYCQGEISTMLVIAPNGVHQNWYWDELPKHLPKYISYSSAYWSSAPDAKERKMLKAFDAAPSTNLHIMCMHIDALKTKKGFEYALQFVKSSSCLVVVDESTGIKNPKAIRTERILKLGEFAAYRRILTGTPITKGPLDVFPQYSFLSTSILNTDNFYCFRARYAVLTEITVNSGRSIKTVTDYQRLDELQKLIMKHSYRVTKEDCLDLPPKLYKKVYIPLSANQRRLYDQLKTDLIADLGNGLAITAPLAITKMLRLQQIVGGYIAPNAIISQNPEEFDDAYDAGYEKLAINQKPQPIDETNERVEIVIEQLRSSPKEKTIIWARFRAEIDAITQAIQKEFGAESVAELHGGIKSSVRQQAMHSYENKEFPTYLVANPACKGVSRGQTLVRGSQAIYYSNSFDLEDRLQSEDRQHRIGQLRSVTYTDYISLGTLDVTVVEALRAKKGLADSVLGDDIRNWI